MKYYPKYIINYLELINIKSESAYYDPLIGRRVKQYVNLDIDLGKFCVDIEYFLEDKINIYWLERFNGDDYYDWFIIYPGGKEEELAKSLNGKLTIEEWIVKSVI